MPDPFLYGRLDAASCMDLLNGSYKVDINNFPYMAVE